VLGGKITLTVLTCHSLLGSDEESSVVDPVFERDDDNDEEEEGEEGSDAESDADEAAAAAADADEG